MTNRIYYIANANDEKFLVDAANPAQALRHLTKVTFPVCRVATAREVATLVAAGAKVETAK